jgi:hypothetical protein
MKIAKRLMYNHEMSSAICSIFIDAHQWCISRTTFHSLTHLLICMIACSLYVYFP